MREQARVVVIGGGVTGCAILYHLAKMGWTDCVLLERRELTSGSSWHAAGSLFALTTPSNAALLQKYTIELYPRLEAESGQSCGYHRSGGLILARGGDESTALRLAHGRARRNGIETQLLSPAEARRLAPILAIEGLDTVLYEPLRGYCDPASVTQAFAKAARDLGATIHRFAPVVETRPLPSGQWDVVTPAGTIRVINGPMIFSPDLGPLLGPYPDLRNYFCACGVMTGFNQGGGIGRVIAEWIVEGEPGLDVFFWDVARFGEWAGHGFTRA